jgi:hypothetical protein
MCIIQHSLLAYGVALNENGKIEVWQMLLPPEFSDGGELLFYHPEADGFIIPKSHVYPTLHRHAASD